MHLRDIWDPSQFCSLLGCNGEDLHHWFQLFSLEVGRSGPTRKACYQDYWRQGTAPHSCRLWQAWEVPQVILIFSLFKEP